ncbi:hypothetical protein IB69_010840 [Xanthomonas citri]|nr:hypothetical protein IB69_010840 [Xanthomonas citri]
MLTNTLMLSGAVKKRSMPGWSRSMTAFSAICSSGFSPRCSIHTSSSSGTRPTWRRVASMSGPGQA